MQSSLHLLSLIAATAFLLCALILVHAIFWGMTFIIDDVHVRVRVYGLTARKVALSDIEWAAQDWVFWNEHWTNTVNPKRMVLLRRRSGETVLNNCLSPRLCPRLFVNNCLSPRLFVPSAFRHE
jgi:hypothetical protein